MNWWESTDSICFHRQVLDVSRPCARDLFPSVPLPTYSLSAIGLTQVTHLAFVNVFLHL